MSGNYISTTDSQKWPIKNFSLVVQNNETIYHIIRTADEYSSKIVKLAKVTDSNPAIAIKNDGQSSINFKIEKPIFFEYAFLSYENKPAEETFKIKDSNS